MDLQCLMYSFEKTKMISTKALLILATFQVLFIENFGLISCNKMKESNLIAQYLQPIKLDENTPNKTLQLKILKNIIKIKSEIMLELSQIELIEEPNGVYELWIGNQVSDLEFIEVLDLYTIQSLKNPIISLPIRNFLFAKTYNEFIYINIIFKGNSITGNGASKKSGILKINKLQIINID